MSQFKGITRGAVAPVISTIIIAWATSSLSESPNLRDTIQMASPLASHILVLLAIWGFLHTGLDTIDGMREAQEIKKLRANLNHDIDTMETAIKSGSLLDSDREDMQRELGKKYKELASVKVKLPKI